MPIGWDQPPEPLGDTEGHSITVGQVTCHIDSGPLSGAILTGTDIYEWNGTNAVALSASGVVRKPGATAVYQESGGKLALTMADGKVTGWTATSRLTYVLATGGAAALAGKSFLITAKPTGPGQFTAEAKEQ
jgi:hypothetical protein